MKRNGQTNHYHFFACEPTLRMNRLVSRAIASSSGRSAILVLSGVWGLYRTQLKCADMVGVCISVCISMRALKFLRWHISHFLLACLDGSILSPNVCKNCETENFFEKLQQ